MVEEKGIKTSFLAILLVQCICVTIIVLFAASVKYIKPKLSKEITSFYKEKMCEKTDINDITKYFKDAF